MARWRARTLLPCIKQLSPTERRKLGFELARRGPGFLPGWRVVKSWGGVEVSRDGLDGKPGELVALLRDGKDHRGRDVIAQLWPEDAVPKGPVPERLWRRLRQQKFR